MYINVGVYPPHNTSKKAFKQAAMLGQAVVYPTSDLSPADFTGKVANLPEGYTLSVVGPDPYHNRKWYATVKNSNGQIRVT